MGKNTPGCGFIGVDDFSGSLSIDAPPWMDMSDTFPLEPEEQPQFLVWTSGCWKPLSFQTKNQTQNGTPKTVKHLWALLPTSQARHLIHMVVQLSRNQVQQLLDVLYGLSDEGLMALAALLESSSPVQLEKYIEVLSDTNPKTQSANQGLIIPQDLIHPLNNTPTKKVPMHDIPMDNMAVSDFRNLQSRIRNTPGEICEKIMDHYFESALVPGYLFPDQTPPNQKGHSFHGRVYPEAESQAFMALSRRLLREYRPRYWFGNTWVIGQGDDDKTTGFLSCMELDIRMNIKAVYLSLSIHDVPGAANLHNYLKFAMQREHGYTDNLKILGHFAHYSTLRSQDLQCTWWYKFSAVCRLGLHDLTLDIRDAYGPDGEFLANADWVSTLTWFWHGVPENFTILTPPSVSADHMRAIIEGNQP